MAFCPKCGTELRSSDKFCPGCGKKVEDTNVRRQEVFEGNVHKCPNCGDTVEAFTARCPSCGFEFRDAQASTAVTSFSAQLQKIESKRKKSALSGIASALGAKDGTDKQTASLIRSFVVPNTKEDVFEFMILACSNIDESLYEFRNQSSDRTVSDAWLAKTNQVYQKAQLTFGDDPDFAKIQSLYDTKMKAIKASKMKTVAIYVVLVAFIVLDLIWLSQLGSA